MSQPSTTQMASRSSSLSETGRPDHSPDIFLAEITNPFWARLRSCRPEVSKIGQSNSA